MPRAASQRPPAGRTHPRMGWWQPWAGGTSVAMVHFMRLTYQWVSSWACKFARSVQRGPCRNGIARWSASFLSVDIGQPRMPEAPSRQPPSPQPPVPEAPSRQPPMPSTPQQAGSATALARIVTAGSGGSKRAILPSQQTAWLRGYSCSIAQYISLQWAASLLSCWAASRCSQVVAVRGR